MKKILAVLLLAVPMMAQTASHSVDVSWNLSPDNTASSVYTVYRASGACPVSGAPTGAVAVGTKTNATFFSDLNVPVGTYCYYVTQTQASTESGPSNNAVAKLIPNAPSGLTVTVK
jgi:hypothetical protein